jgi:two-component SAPR family response regulator
MIENEIEDLTQSGAEIRLVNDLGDAMDMLRNYRPDVLISDITRNGNEEAGFEGLQALEDEELYRWADSFLHRAHDAFETKSR